MPDRMIKCIHLSDDGVCLKIGMKIPGSNCDRYHYWIEKWVEDPYRNIPKLRKPACLEEDTQ